VKNGDLAENRTSYLEGERAEIRCNEGYRVQYTRSRTLHLICNKDGHWQNYLGQEDLPTCQSKYHVNVHGSLSIYVTVSFIS
jgi:hypothetical protein